MGGQVNCCGYEVISEEHKLGPVGKAICGFSIVFFTSLVLYFIFSNGGSELTLDEQAVQYLAARDALALPMLQEGVKASWAHDANLTEENRKNLEEVQERAGQLDQQLWEQFLASGWPQMLDQVKDNQTRRILKDIAESGGIGLSSEEYTEMNSLLSDMKTLYSTGQVDLCVSLDGQQVCQLNLEPELTNLLATSRDYDELTAAWVGWRNVSGRLVRDKYLRYVALASKQAVARNFTNLTEQKLRPYETENFRDIVEDLYQDLRPLYLQLHAYVRRKLRDVYGEDKISQKGAIPAHLLGNMWGQTWGSISDILVPFPEKQQIDVTDAMKEQGYTPLKMVQLSDSFFSGLNLTAMSDEFWANSIFEKPPNTEMVCHASAWSFYNGTDFRIKMCTEVTMEKLGVIHHEMGHVEYYAQYNDQPVQFRGGANPGFHEAVGDALALSVLTPKHLNKIGLLANVTEDTEADLNFLLTTALKKVAFLPFGYLIDSYRWDVFSGLRDDLNCFWWQKRYSIQGLKPPVQRSEDDFDPGSKYHVVADVPYIRYFVSYIIQFQFHKAMCIKAGQYDPNDPTLPLHKCDVDQSAEAGNALASMLKLGSSRPWPEALENLTGSREMDAGVLREYFAPLEEWLVQDNAAHDQYIGWTEDDPFGSFCAS